MNQPDLGLKVSELRQQKGLTQEQLAERCEVSARTIQRIESGEVDPRAYTLHCLGEALEFDFGEENTGNENLWLAILHLSSMFCIVIIPLAAVVVEEESILQDRPARTPGAQLPDHHDAVALCRIVLHARRLACASPVEHGYGRGICHTGFNSGYIQHPSLHLHRHLLHLPGRGQCHAGAVGQTHPTMR